MSSFLFRMALKHLTEIIRYLIFSLSNVISVFKEATKSYFTHYPWVVIILFNKGLCRSALSTISFEKLVFHLFVPSGFFVKSNADTKRHFRHDFVAPLTIFTLKLLDEGFL